MVIDNSEKIRSLLKFPKETSFYFVQILQRRKEHPTLESNARNVDNFFIYNLEDFDKYLPKIIDCCNRFNARAYFRLNIRDAEVIAQRAIQKGFELLIAKNFKQVKNAYLHACGERHSDDDKTWVVDIDRPERYNDMAFGFLVNRIKYNIKKQNGNIVEQLPTKNGVHLITKPFRLDFFKKDEPDVDVHKDNPTILYVP
jgi:hypothetical protein